MAVAASKGLRQSLRTLMSLTWSAIHLTHKTQILNTDVSLDLANFVHPQCVCMCVCMYVCMYVQLYECMYVCVCMRPHQQGLGQVYTSLGT